MNYTQGPKNFFISIMFLNAFLILIYIYGFILVENAKDTKFAESRKNLNEVNSIQLNYSTFKKAIDDTREGQSKIKNAVVDKKTVADLMRKIEDLADKADVSLTKSVSMERSPVTKENFLKFDMRIKGKFSDVFYFLGLQENIPYKIRIKKLGIGAGESEIIADALKPEKGKKTSVKEEIAWSGDISLDFLSYINE